MAKNPVANIGVDLTTRIAGFEANMDKATRKLRSSQRKMNRSLDRMQQGFKKLGARIAAFAGAAGVALAARGLNNLSKRAIESGDLLAKQADRIGVSVDRLQELRFAAERGGLGIEKLDAGLGRFSKAIGEARARTGTLFTLLQRLDPNLLQNLIASDDLDEALDLILTRLQNTRDAMERNALSAAAFGRTGGAAFGVFAGQVNDLSRELRDMGGVLDESLARKAEAAADKLTNLETTLRVKLNTAVLENIDGFLRFKEAINAVEIASVKAAAAVGNIFSGRFAPGSPPDFSDPAILAKKLANEKSRRAALTERLENINDANPALRLASGGLAQILKTEIATANDTIARLEKLQGRRAFQAAVEALNAPRAGGAGGAGEGAGLTVPPAGAAPKRIDLTAPPLPGIRAPSLSKRGEERTAALKKIADEAANAAAEATRRAAQFKFEIAAAGEAAADAFGRAIVFGERLDKTLKNIVKTLASRLIGNFLFNAVSAKFPFLKGPGGFAGGGRLSGPALVGERGPELIAPQRPVSVVNAADTRRALSGARVVVNQTIAPNFAGNAATQDDLIAMGRIAKQAAIAGTIEALRRPSHA